MSAKKHDFSTAELRDDEPTENSHLETNLEMLLTASENGHAVKGTEERIREIREELEDTEGGDDE